MQEEEFEKEYVHKFYEKKSQPFSDSRVKPWPFTVEFMKKYTTESSLILDSGCGNGRQFMHANTVGLDFSANLLGQAIHKPNIGLIKGNIHDLPFLDSTFDAVLSIAVIHHLSTQERRAEAMMEMKRVLKNGGICLVYAWHKEASAKEKFHPIKNDEYFVSWRKECDLMRYYHLFTEETLKDLCEEAGFEILEIKREQESIYAVIKKC